MFSPCLVAHYTAKDVYSCLHVGSAKSLVLPFHALRGWLELCLGHSHVVLSYPLQFPASALPGSPLIVLCPHLGSLSYGVCSPELCTCTYLSAARGITRAGIIKDWKALGRIQCRMQRGGVCQSHPLSQTDSHAVDVGSLEGKCPVAWVLGVSAAVQETWGWLWHCGDLKITVLFP